MRQVGKIMRLDRFLCEMNMGSRSGVKELIRRKQVTINGKTALSADLKINEFQDEILCQGVRLTYRPYVYYMMNKPGGVVCATTDAREQTVLDLLKPVLPLSEQKRTISPAGRLDKDTEGLLLLTDNGELVHALLSPKKHVDKTYLVKIAHRLSPGDIEKLEQGIDISASAPVSEKEPQRNRLTLPATVAVQDDTTILLTIHEGRFHQVKRMLQAVDNEVVALKRIAFGPLKLDPSLSTGACRELTREEIQQLTCASADIHKM